MQLNARALAPKSGEASDLLKALANRHRLLILCQLIDRDQTVGELMEVLGIRLTGVSQHLAVLRREGLVEARRSGQTIRYSIASGPAQAIVQTLYRSYCAAPLRRKQKVRKS